MYTAKSEQRIEHVCGSKGPSPIFSRNPYWIPEKKPQPNAPWREECHLVLRGKLEVQHGEDIAIVEEGDSFSMECNAFLILFVI